jgi:hypothetical protein
MLHPLLVASVILSSIIPEYSCLPLCSLSWVGVNAVIAFAGCKAIKDFELCLYHCSASYAWAYPEISRGHVPSDKRMLRHRQHHNL